MKAYQERKKKQEYFGGRDTTKRSMVHYIGYATIVNTGIWVSVMSDGDDEILPSGGSTSLDKRES